MSEITKPVDESISAPVVGETPKVVEPVSESKLDEPIAPIDSAAAPLEQAPATSEEIAAAEDSAPAVLETPAVFSGEGELGYKAPGGFLKKLAGFQKQFFWFGEEAVEPKSLASYIRGEKAEIANHNAAWSSQTGKGLLFHSKHASEKATPAGIINLSEISEVSEKGTLDFVLTAHGLKHTFQAKDTAERDAWIKALNEKSVEAKEVAEDIKSSEGYKSAHSSLAVPAVAAAATSGAGSATKNTEIKKEEKAEAKEEKAEAKAEKEEEKEVKKEEKKTRKDRSVSRKRNSIFGNFGIGKKEDKTEAPVEPAVAPVEEDSVVGPVDPVAEPAPLDAEAIAAAVVAAPLATEETVEPARPVNSKRNSSFFDTLSSRFGSKKSVSEEAPAVPAKDVAAEPVSAEAPVIPEPEATEPLSTTVASPATVPENEISPSTPTTEEATETKPAVKSDKRKSSMPFGFGQKKEKSATSDSEGEKAEKKASPFAKLRQTVKAKTSPRSEKTPVVSEKSAVEPLPTTEISSDAAATEPEAEQKVASESVPATTASPAVVSATA